MPSSPPTCYSYLGLNPQGDLGDYTIYRTRRGRIVIYLKAPPKKPWSPWQLNQRSRWAVIATAWTALPDATKEAWHTASRRAGLRVTGYNLYVWYQCNPDPAALATIARQAGLAIEDLL